MEYCWIPSCKNYKRADKQIKLYPVPEGVSEKNAWAKAFGLDPNLMQEDTRICSSHFLNKSTLQDMFVGKNLSFLSGGGLINLSFLPGVNSQLQLPEGVNAGQFMIPSLQIPVNRPLNSNIAVPHTNIALPHSNIALQHSNIALPHSNFALPHSNIALQHSNISLPRSNIALPRSNIALPHSNITVPNSTITVPNSNIITIPNSTITVANSNIITVPNSNIITVPNSNIITVPNSIITVSNSNIAVLNRNGTISNSNVTVPSSSVTVPSSSVAVPNSNVTVSDKIIDEVHSEKTGEASAMRNLLMCELLLECQEDNLSEVQKNFHSVEWNEYVKYNTSIRQLPHVSAVNASELGDRVSDCKVAPELPLLIFTNAPPNNQTVFTPPCATPASSQTPIALGASLLRPTAPQNISSDIKLNISSPSAVISTPSVLSPSLLSPQPIFPVRLEKVIQPPSKDSPPQSNEEEIFPLISPDCLTDSLFNKVVPNGCGSSVQNDLSVPSTSKSVESSSMKRTDSPTPSEDSESLCLSPGQLCNVEITVDETENPPMYSSPIPSVSEFPSPSTSFESEDSNGPRIVGILSGKSVASAFYNNDLMAMEVEPPFVPENKTPPVESIPSENSMPKTVTQWSIFAMQKTIAVISSGSLEASVHNLLGIRPNIPPPSPDKDVGTTLKNRLREENFMTLAPWWLVEKRFLPLRPPCSCGGKIYKLNTSYTYADNLAWKCYQCNTLYPVKRPRFFDLFPQFSLEEVMLLTYHWACKSRLWVIMKDIPVKEEKIWSFFSSLQKLCGSYVSKNCHIGKSSKFPVTVEVSAVKLGKFFILCAFDRRSKFTRLQALTTEEACSTLKHIQILEEWLGPYCTLITWKKIGEEFLPGINKVSADPSITQVLSPGRHILNASKYLGKTMVQLFQNISHDQLTLDVVQGYLNEVQWRERLGRIEESAFWGILNEVCRLNENYSYTEAVLGDLAKDRYFYKSDITFQMRWGPFDIGSKSSWTYNISEVSDKAKQEISNSVEKITKKMQDSVVVPCTSTSKHYADEIAAAKKKHPISFSYSVAPPSNAGNKIYGELINSQDLLSIKMRFETDEKYEKALKTQADILGERLRREGFLRRPVRWLVNCKFIQDETLCYVCRGKARLVDNIKFSDGVSWLCEKPHCKFENRFRRPSFFATFGFRLDFLFAIIYHWAVQSDYKIVIKSVPLNEFNIISVHRRIQKICSEIIKKPTCKIGGKKFLVEVALVKFANCFILGAMERDTKLSRFRAFAIQTKLHIDAIRKTLISWLFPGSTVIVNSNKYLGQYCMEEKIHLVFADRDVKDVNSDKYHTLTISNYLQTHLKSMFSSIKVNFMSADLLQIYLDELVWRERFGRSPTLAFQNIFKDIFALEHGAGASGVSTNKEVNAQYAESLGVSLPLPEARVVLERLPEHVIERYTHPVEEVTIIECFEPDKPIKQEVISDDEIEIIKFVPNSEKSTTSSPVKESTDVQTNINLRIENPRTESPRTESPRIENPRIENPRIENLRIESPRIEKPKIEKPKPSTSGVSFGKHEERKRYSEKCYTHRRKDDLVYTRFRCMECKDVVHINHFGKWFSCADCKYNTYTTCCPKAYAQHRSPILFGKKMARTLQEFEGTFQRPILLPEFWYCFCGYSSADGNKLATHLIKCEKTTCYLQSDDTSSNSIL